MWDKQRPAQPEEATDMSSDPNVPLQSQTVFAATVDCQLFEALLACQQQQLRENLQQSLQQQIEQLLEKSQQQMHQVLDQSHVSIATILQDGFILFREQLQQSRLPKFASERTLDISASKGVSPPVAGRVNGTVVAALEATEIVEGAAQTTIARPIKDNATAVSNPKSAGTHDFTKLNDLMDEEPDDNQMLLQERIAKFMKGSVAHSFIGCCVMMNTITMFLHLQILGNIADDALGLNTATASWRITMDIVGALEYVFGTIFLVELLLNLYAFRWQYFLQFSNVADAALVLFTSIVLLILEPIDVRVKNLSFFRVLRLAKLARVLRIVRVMTFFDHLRILITTAMHSFAALFWSMVIMFILMVVGTTFLCQMLHDFVVDEAADLATRSWVNHMFGNGDRTLYTVFEMTFSGCWPNYASRVVKEVGASYAAFFAMYVIFVNFGMIRIISALFLKETMDQAARDHDIVVQQHKKKAQRLKEDLGDIFQETDTSGDGTLSKEEMDNLLSHSKVVHWFGELGIDSSDAHLLFELLDDGDGAISKQEFVEGIIRVKGPARSQDLVPVMANVQRLLVHCKHMRKTCDALETSMSTMEASRHAESLKCISLVPSLLPPLSNSRGGVASRTK